MKPTTSVEQTSDYLRSAAALERQQHAELRMLHAHLKALPQASPYSDEELDQIERDLKAYQLWQRKQAFLTLHPSCTWHRQQLLVMPDDLHESFKTLFEFLLPHPNRRAFFTNLNF